MKKIPLLGLFLLIFALGIGSTEAAVLKGWKSYKGHYFEVGVPPGVVATPQGEVDKSGRADEVSLWNENLKIQFCVYSPLWNGRALFQEVNNLKEVLTSRESKKTGDVTVEELTVAARDKSYIRFVVIQINTVTNNNTTYGIRVPNMKVYEEIRPTYVAWKKSLSQWSD